MTEKKTETKAQAKAKDIATRKRLGIRGLPKDIYQSFAFTVSRYKWSIYEKRIVYRLIELAQCELQGIRFNDGLHNVEPMILTESKEITMPVQDILANEKDTNFEIAKKAFKSLAKKGLEYENKDIWAYINVISKPTITKGSGLVKFEVADEFWNVLLKFGDDPKGYRKFELLTAMSFESVYSMRLYELVSGQNRPLEYDLDTLGKMLQLTKRMMKVNTFEEKVLNVAHAELEEKAPYGFTYKRKTIPSRGRNKEKVVGYILTPYPIHKNRNHVLEIKDITSKLPAGGRFGGLLDPEVYRLLTKELGWPKASANSNKTILLKAQNTLPNFKNDLRRWGGEARTATNPIGYVITCIKNEVEEYERDNAAKAQAAAPTSAPVPEKNQEGKRRLQDTADLFANQFTEHLK